MVRVGERWQISHHGKVVAEHPVLAGRHELRVDPAHGPGAVSRNARSRYGVPRRRRRRRQPALHDVEVRDLAVYEQLLEVA